MPKRTLMLSVKPKYAAMLLSGKKTVELRRIRPRVEPGDVVLLSATLPECRIVGYCHVTKVLLEGPTALWSDVGSATGVSRVDFDRYVEGVQTAVGIVMERPAAISERLSLEDLRRLVPGFRPPQSFRYIGSTEKKLQQVLWVQYGGLYRRMRQRKAVVQTIQYRNVEERGERFETHQGWVNVTNGQLRAVRQHAMVMVLDYSRSMWLCYGRSPKYRWPAVVSFDVVPRTDWLGGTA